MEIHRKKNVATYIFFPLVDADGALVSGTGNPDSECDTFADGTAPDGFADLTNEATEIGATGWYYLSLTQAEMNFDYIAIQVKSDDALTQCILINTKPLTEIGVIDGIVDDILVDTGTTIPGTITTIDNELATVDGIVDAIKAVTDNLPNSGALTDIDTGVNNIEAKLPTNYIMGSSDQTDKDDDIDAILVDTGTTLPATLTTIEGKIDTADTVVDAIKAVTDNLPDSGALNDLAAILTDTGTTLETKINKILCLCKNNLAVEFDWDANNDNNQTDFYGYDTAANATTNDHSTGKVVHITGTTASFTNHKPATTIFIDADE